MGDKIKEYFEDGSKWNVNIQYFEEKIPLGNAGALFKIRNLIFFGVIIKCRCNV